MSSEFSIYVENSYRYSIQTDGLCISKLRRETEKEGQPHAAGNDQSFAKSRHEGMCHF